MSTSLVPPRLQLVLLVAAAFTIGLLTHMLMSTQPVGADHTLEHRVQELEDLLDGATRSGDTLTFDGMNLQITNGAGTTTSSPRPMPDARRASWMASVPLPTPTAWATPQ